MTFQELTNYCNSMNMVSQEFPFGPETVVYKVAGKVFALCSMDSFPLQFNVKCDPELAIELREKYENVIPGYHMSKKHWNTIICTNLSDKFLKEQILNSYNLVVTKLPKKIKSELNLTHNIS